MSVINTTKSTNTNTVKPNTTVTPAKATADNYEADQREVDSKSTVAGQMTGLLDKGGDYMKRAETKGLQVANKRGLLNSSFAVGAAHGAAIDAALPIAQQDASTHNNQSLVNQSASNQANQFNANTNTNVNLANQNAENRASEFNSSMSFDSYQADRDREHSEFMSRLDHANSMGQMSAEAAANLKGEYVKAFDSIRKESVININEIQNNPNITGPNKTAMINQEIARRNSDIAATRSIYSSLPQWSQSWASFPSV